MKENEDIIDNTQELVREILASNSLAGENWPDLKNVIKDAAKEGIKVGLIRPITLWPFPSASFAKYADKCKRFLCVEMSTGQMLEDVKLAVNGRNEVEFYGRTGGNVPSQSEILEQVRRIAAEN